MNQQDVKSVNQAKFYAVRELKLPMGHWAITSSGPMGVRGLRLIGDVDVIVDNKLWAQLKTKYGVKHENGLIKIDVPGEIDIVSEETFPGAGQPGPGRPSINDQIREADIIDGLPFVKLEYVVYFKTQLGREKDKKDIEMIKDYLKSNQVS